MHSPCLRSLPIRLQLWKISVVVQQLSPTPQLRFLVMSSLRWTARLSIQQLRLDPQMYLCGILSGLNRGHVLGSSKLAKSIWCFICFIVFSKFRVQLICSIFSRHSPAFYWRTFVESYNKYNPNVGGQIFLSSFQKIAALTASHVGCLPECMPPVATWPLVL